MDLTLIIAIILAIVFMFLIGKIFEPVGKTVLGDKGRNNKHFPTQLYDQTTFWLCLCSECGHPFAGFSEQDDVCPVCEIKRIYKYTNQEQTETRDQRHLMQHRAYEEWNFLIPGRYQNSGYIDGMFWLCICRTCGQEFAGFNIWDDICPEHLDMALLGTYEEQYFGLYDTPEAIAQRKRASMIQNTAYKKGNYLIPPYIEALRKQRIKR